MSIYGGEKIMTEKQYISKVCRKLQCGSARKKEICRQLASDIDAAVSAGKSVGEVLNEMGTPEALAADFNENFTEAERKAAKHKRTGIIVGSFVVLFIAICAVLYWWLPKGKPLTDGSTFQEENVKAQAEEVIRTFSAGDYEGVINMMDEKMQAAATAETLEVAKEKTCADWGALKELGNCYMSEIEQSGVTYVAVQQSAIYENVAITFTISFDADGKICGFYMK